MSFLQPNAPAGWYPDPYAQAPWRWWDGQAWSSHLVSTLAPPPKKSILPNWLSWPVVICSPFVLLFLVLIAITDFIAIPLGLLPLLIVLPALGWLDRVEPEPKAGRYHALLWGASVAVLFAYVINSFVALVLGEAIAAIFSAPIVEEAVKGLGVYWAYKRAEIDGVMDGIVYAGWVAVGFAVVEDMFYLADAADEGLLVPTLILRVFLTPFAHPLFTFWIGLAIGLAVAKGKPVALYAAWGYGLAVFTHMSWNGSLILGELFSPALLLMAIVLFILLFVAVVVGVIMVRVQQQRSFIASMPWLAYRYGLTHQELQVFASWRGMLRFRRSLTRANRAKFDRVHAALGRLALLQQRTAPMDLAKEQRLAAELEEARLA